MSTRGLRKTREGVVVSDKMDKSVIVEVSRTVMHPLYQKYVRKRTRFMAHDESNALKIGDRVRIVESRPLSRRKRWRVQEKLA
ncbi:MAG TPA: 30S ribosomal protein S17 [Myxococcota bacterium]|jgi:small subunit ribosomal protein S17|nr:30S ribosomal protein S17 [Myxococcota bacterium]